MKKVLIYTDGSCLGNPGNGGYAALLFAKKGEYTFKKVISGYEANSTNNRMELTAAIQALKAIKQPCNVEIFTDSEYLMRSYSNLPLWVKQGWRNTAGPVKNADLWKQLRTECAKHGMVSFKKVTAHSNNKYNEECDQIAKKEAKKCELLRPSYS